MQKKHLHTYLTICFVMLLSGCGDNTLQPQNPYLSGESSLNVEITNNKIITARWGSLETVVRADREGGPITLNAAIDGHFRINSLLPELGGTAGETIRAVRTLTSLQVTDTAGKPQAQLVPLPRGHGFALTIAASNLADRAYSFSVHSAAPNAGVPGGLTPRWVEAGNNVVVWPSPTYGNLALAVDPVDNLFEIASRSGPEDDSGEVSIFQIPTGESLRLVFAVDPDPNKAVVLAREYLKLSEQKLAQQARNSIVESAAFELQTEDDRTNRAFALLTASIVGAEDYPQFTNRESIADYSDRSGGFALATRARSAVLFPGTDPALDRQLTAFSEDDRLLWSLHAIRTSLSYGLFSQDTLSLLQSRALAALSAADEKLTSVSPSSLYPVMQDTAMQAVLANIWLADVFELGAEISALRGQQEAHDHFRKKYVSAAGDARTDFKLIHSDWRSRTRLRKQALEQQEESPSTPEALAIPGEDEPPPILPPDTLSLIRAGARYGFNHVTRDPAGLMAEHKFRDPAVWQRWVAYRFNHDSHLKSTSDCDSLLTALLSGDAPGMLTMNVNEENSPGLTGTAIALENIASIYLGVKPEWTNSKLHIDPRPPAEWGHTFARVPLGTGWLLLEYDFLHEIARMQIEGIDRELAVLFKYPLPSGKSLATQFKLGPSRPQVQINLERESGNRLRLTID